MKEIKCLYYEKKDTPTDLSEGIAWIDPGDGSDPFPDLVIYRDGVWLATNLECELEPVKNIGKIICVQKLVFPGWTNVQILK